MGIAETLAPVVQVVMYATYAAYCVVGIGCAVLGGINLSNENTLDFVTYGMFAVGMLMLVVGGLGLLAAHKKMWVLMVMVEICNLALFFMLLFMVVVAFVLASGTTDPIRRAFETSYGEAGKVYTADQMAAQTEFRAGQWRLGACARDFTPNAGCVAFAKASALSSEQAEYYGNCTTLPAAKQGAFLAPCVLCVKQCREASIVLAGDNLKLVTYVAIGAFVYVCLALGWNNTLVDTEGEWSGFKGQVGLVLNGSLLLLALGLFGLGIYGAVTANAEDVCPSGDCIGMAVYGCIVVGLFLIVVSGMAVFAIRKNSPIFLHIADQVLVWMGLALLFICVFLMIISGAMDDVNAKYDENFEDLKKAANSAADQVGEEQVCTDFQVNTAKAAGVKCVSATDTTTAGCDAAGLAKFNVAQALDVKRCKSKLRENFEADASLYAVIATFVVLGYMVVIYLTKAAIELWRGGESSDE